MPVTPSLWATRPTSCRCCHRVWCKASVPSSAMAWWSIPGPCWRKSPRSAPPALPLHREREELGEEADAQKIGTPKRGIGPAYEDKVGRRAIRAIDLKDPATLPAKIERLLAHHNVLRKGFGAPEVDAAVLLASLNEIAPKIAPFLGSSWRELEAARQAGKRVLFEGAQAVLLDTDHGNYPFVTSSNTVAGQAAPGAGVSPRAIGTVL